MSDSTTPTTTKTPPDMRGQPESLWSQSFIYGVLMLPVAAGVIILSFLWLDKQVASTIAAMSIPLLLAPSNFFFGAAKHQPQDGPQTLPPGSTTTTTVAPAPGSTTTTTGTKT